MARTKHEPIHCERYYEIMARLAFAKFHSWHSEAPTEKEVKQLRRELAQVLAGEKQV